MAFWKPDSCECKLEFSKLPNIKENFIKFTKKCKIHNKYDEVLKHNQDFNLKYGNEPTQSQLKLILENKRKEKTRIKKLI